MHKSLLKTDIIRAFVACLLNLRGQIMLFLGTLKYVKEQNECTHERGLYVLGGMTPLHPLGQPLPQNE